MASRPMTMRKYTYLFHYYENHDISEGYNNSTEIGFAIAAKRKLRDDGINCYVDWEDGCLGGNIITDFEQVAADSRYLVLIMNKNSLKKFQVEENNISTHLFHCELFRRIKEGRSDVFPILLDDFDDPESSIPFSLENRPYARFYHDESSSGSSEGSVIRTWELENHDNIHSWTKLKNTGKKDLSQRQIPLDGAEQEPITARPSQLALLDGSQILQPPDGATGTSQDRPPADSPDDTSAVPHQVSEDSITSIVSGHTQMTASVGTGAQSATSTTTMERGSPSFTSPSTQSQTSGLDMDFDGSSSITSNTNASFLSDQLDSFSIQSEPFSPILGNTSSGLEQLPFNASSLHGQQGGGDSTPPGNSDAVDGESSETESVHQSEGPEAEQQRPGAELQGPEAEQRRPGAELQGPEAEQRRPGAELQGPEAEQRRPGAELQGLEAEQRRPGAELQGLEAEQRRPGAELQGPEAEQRRPGAELQGLEAEEQKSGAELQGPGAELQGTGAELQGPGAELQGLQAGLYRPERQHEDIANDAREPASLSSLGEWIGNTQEIRSLRQTYEELGISRLFRLFSYFHSAFYSTTDFSAYLSPSKHG